VGEPVEFISNGVTVSGYLAHPTTGAGLGVIVVHDRRGLVPPVEAVCDRLAIEGFTALAPDLSGGDQAEDAGADRAVLDMSAAIDHLASHDAVRGEGVGVIGYGMGGGLAFLIAGHRRHDVRAIVAYYGVIPWPVTGKSDWSTIAAAVQGHYGEDDERFPVDQARQLEQELKNAGVDVELFYYSGCGHGFADEVGAAAYREHEAREAWVRTLEFLRAKLG